MFTKNILFRLSLVTILLTTCAFAQTTPFINPILHNSSPNNNFLPLAKTNQSHFKAKTTSGNASRLIQQADLVFDTLTHNFIATDTTFQTYTGSRGFGLPYVGWKFDSFYLYTIGSMGSLNNYYKSWKLYDTNNNLLTYTVQQWNNYTSEWINNQNQLYTYDGTNNITSVTYQFWDSASNSWLNSYLDSFSYNSSNKVLCFTSLSWSPYFSTWSYSTRDFYTYNTANLDSTDFSQSYFIGTWVNTLLWTFIHDGSNNEVGAGRQIWSNYHNSWQDDLRIIYNLDGSGNTVTDSYQSYDTISGLWKNSFFDSMSNFIDKSPMTLIRMYWNSNNYINSYKYDYTYNSYNQMTSYYESIWDIPSNTFIKNNYCTGAHYYYEEYISSVKNLSNTNGTATLYPIPAHGSVNINIFWDEPQEYTISIIDMQGKTINTLSFPASTNNTTQLPLSCLKSGNYIINIIGAKGRIAKLITVE